MRPTALTGLAAGVVVLFFAGRPAYAVGPSDPIWQLEDVIERSDRAEFGTTIALDRDPGTAALRVLVTSVDTFRPNPNDKPYKVATIHVYRRSAGGRWTYTGDLPRPPPVDSNPQSIFGESVVLAGSTVLVSEEKDPRIAGGAVLVQGRYHVFREDPRDGWRVAETVRTPKPAGDDPYWSEPLVAGATTAWMGADGSCTNPCITPGHEPKSRLLRRSVATPTPALPWTLDPVVTLPGVPLAFDDPRRTVAIVTLDPAANAPDIVTYYQEGTSGWNPAGATFKVRVGAPPYDDFHRTELSKRSAFRDGVLVVPGGAPSGTSNDLYVRIGTAAPTTFALPDGRPAYGAAMSEKFVAVVAGPSSTAGGNDVLLVFSRAPALPWKLTASFDLGPKPTAPITYPEGTHVEANDRSIVVAWNGRVAFFRYGTPKGGECSDSVPCASDFCVDGVCCEIACGGGDTRDCQACTTALTARPEGVCAPAKAGSACGVEPTDECDEAERCDGVANACPADRKKPDGSECSRGACRSGRCGVAAASIENTKPTVLEDGAPVVGDDGCSSSGGRRLARWHLAIVAATLGVLLAIRARRRRR